MKDIPGYEGIYAITENGEVWAYPKTGKGGHQGMWMKPYPDKDGYSLIGLRKKNIRVGYKVHRLVAEMFIPNPQNKPCVCHNNDIRSDNRVKNLWWGTHQENEQDKIKKNRRPEQNGRHNGGGGRPKINHKPTLP